MFYKSIHKRKYFPLLVCILFITLFYSCQSLKERINTVASDYVILTLRIDKHHRGFVDAYIGSESVRKNIEAEPLTDLAVLRKDAEDLLQRLDKINDGTGRTDFIKKQATAAQTFIRKLEGEKFTLFEEAKLLFDIEPELIPENFYEAAIEKINSLLPGKEETSEKLAQFGEPLLLREDEVEKVLDICMKEVRNRTMDFLPLPSEESIIIEFVKNKPWGAYNWFKGNSHSLIQINTDLPRGIFQILHYASHEGYPGHHTDLTLKEEYFYKKERFPEYSVFPLYAPQNVIAEGIAEAGMWVVFSEQEKISFVKDVLLPVKGLKSFDIEKWNTLDKLLETLSSVSGNAAILLFEKGRSEKDITEYLQKYGLMSEESAKKRLEFIKTYRSYIFNYYYGYNLVKKYLERGNPRERFRELIMGHFYPSLLKE